MMTPYEHLCAVQQAYDKATDAVCKRYNIKHKEFDILMYLEKYPNQATATDIVKKMDLSKSLVSISLRALEEHGYVRGEYHGTNHRTIYLRLTDSAEEVIAAGREAQNEFIEALLNGFSKEETKELFDFLSRLKKNMLSYSKKI